jgi:L-histidine N-alpha-methyltransferase
MIGAEGAGLGLRRVEGEQERFLEDVLAGLSAPQKTIPSKWLYDARGCDLYELITELPEYYPTRTELAILDAHAAEIAAAVGPDALVFEYGTGSGNKTGRLLEALRRPAAYLPVDIAREALLATAEALVRRFPGLPVRPVWTDFSEPFTLPADDLRATRRLGFFPGSTIGNFDLADAVLLLRQMAGQAGRGGALLVGVDLRKDAATLQRASDDPRGVTAAFDLNLLGRVNRELGGDFRLSAFRHRAVFDDRRSRVEMHLESLEDQLVTVAGRTFAFRAGETIHTESSYKYVPREFDALAALAGWRLERTWTDERAWFAVKLYAASGG